MNIKNKKILKYGGENIMNNKIKEEEEYMNKIERYWEDKRRLRMNFFLQHTKGGIILQAVQISVLIIMIVLFIKEENKEYEIRNYVKTVIIDKTVNSNDYISSKIFRLKEQFGTKSKFLNEVEAYKIKKAKEEKAFLNN